MAGQVRGIGRLARPGPLLVILGLVMVALGTLGGIAWLTAAGMMAGGLGVIVLGAQRAVSMWRGESLPGQARPTTGRRLAAALGTLPFIGMLGVVPILIGLAYGLGEKSLLDAAAIAAAVCLVVVAIVPKSQDVRRLAGWLQRHDAGAAAAPPAGAHAEAEEAIGPFVLGESGGETAGEE